MAPRILVVEDDPSILENITEFLEGEGFIVITAINGEEGILQAETLKPDLILCDRMMKPGTGLEVLAAVRSDPVTAMTAFVFVTALADKDDFRRGMTMGADDYLTKPFTRKDLLGAVYTQLEKTRSRAADTKSKMAVVSESIRTHLQHIYGNLELYRSDNPTALENEEFADAWNATVLAIAKIDKLIAAMVPRQG